jgi:hypothetical protein
MYIIFIIIFIDELKLFFIEILEDEFIFILIRMVFYHNVSIELANNLNIC